jgi:hypothetical protein
MQEQASIYFAILCHFVNIGTLETNGTNWRLQDQDASKYIEAALPTSPRLYAMTRAHESIHFAILCHFVNIATLETNGTYLRLQD